MLVTDGGLIFTGTLDGKVIALDEATGKFVWEFQTGSSINATPITYTYKGRQYVSIASGLGGQMAAAFAFGSAAAQSPPGEQFPPEQIRKGAETFAVFCAPCHGERMSNPEFFNLRTFPPDQRSRFINSVTNGKNAMPPWRGQLKPEDIEALWSYVVAGEKEK